MKDPHVVALKFSIEHDDTVEYDDAKPIECEGPEFSIRVADKQVHVEFKTHHTTENAALNAVDLYIRSWELGAALDGRPGQFTLRFQGSSIVDRNPPPPTPGICDIGITVRAGIPTVRVSAMAISLRPYPIPPLEITLDPDNPDVLTMFDRFRGYLEEREPLASMAYFCLTILTNYLCKDQNCAARTYAISLHVLRKVGELTSRRGGWPNGGKESNRY